jgi:cation:H+ antiporter
VQVSFILAGLAMLVFGSRWMVDGAVALAHSFGLSELVVGLTIVAAGTSLPELATSIIAALRGQNKIAVGNIVGSNIANILFGLGMTGMIAPGGIDVPSAALKFYIPVMIAAAVICLPVFFIDRMITLGRRALLSYYAALCCT